MLQNLKALVVVLLVATTIFALAKPVCLRFTSPEDFARRRTVWFLLTITAFVSPSFWLYALVAAPTMAWAAKKDASPLALYLLLLFVIPPVEIPIPTIGIKQLFDLGQTRLMALVILLPMAWQRLQSRPDPAEGGGGLKVVDMLILMYGAWQLVLLLPYENPTNSVRRAFLFYIDTFLPFYLFSRESGRRSALVDMMAALCLSALIMAPLAAFESLRQWLLYTNVVDVWGAPNRDAWLFRGDALRAQVSTGHAIPLGYVFAMALGFWFYLKTVQIPKARSTGFFALVLVGLFFTYARGPWLTAALVTLIVLSLGSQNSAKLMRSVLVVAVIGGLIAITPIGQQIIDNLPFVGHADQDSVAYRQQLAETSWRLIQDHPFIGNPFVMLEMEELRQGQGIIDLVNAYANVALFYGLIGLTMYAAAQVMVLLKAYACLKRARLEGDDALALIGACLLACKVADMFFMATAGFSWLQWILAGMAAGYAGLQAVPRTESVDAAELPRGRRAFSA